MSEFQEAHTVTETAYPDILELFFQVFDKGREIDFKYTIIILALKTARSLMIRPG